MEKDNSTQYRYVYPRLRGLLSSGRVVHKGYKNFQCLFKNRSKDSSVIPTSYNICNTTTIDSKFVLNVVDGSMPEDIHGNLYICQCLGTPGAFMVGDTNIVKMSFKEEVSLENKLLWTPVTFAKTLLQKTKYRFGFFGLMFMSPGIGISSYTEGMYLLPDGRLGITSDVDRPWIIERDSLKAVSPLGSTKEWIPMASGAAKDMMGGIFAGYNNSHVIYTDMITNELFLVNYQAKQMDGTSPCQLMKWDGKSLFESWQVVDNEGDQITIMQSIHELIFTRDYILLADTAFIAGTEMFAPWKDAPLPNPKTVVYVVDRRHLTKDNKTVVSKRIEIDEACIHLIAKYENPDDIITMYMLHTPATNTAEIIKHYDEDLDGNLFPKNLIGYGTLPVLDISSVGKHCIDMKETIVISSDYLRDLPYCWGPYMYTYMDRQVKPFQDQDLFIFFKGFDRSMLPKRIYKAYKDADNRRISLEDMLENGGMKYNNSIARINQDSFEIVDAYVMPDKVLIYTISCIASDKENHPGYLLVAVARDIEDNQLSSGHEYWLFKADDLSSGPVCKLGHKELNNSILFHTVYIPDSVEETLNKHKAEYIVPIHEDYPREHVAQWGDEVTNIFDEYIYPYYESKDIEDKLSELSKQRIVSHSGKEYMIGEEYIEDAPSHARRMIDEANRMFSTTGWKVESNKEGVVVESKPISGPLESSGICVTRASATLQCNASKLFDFITSPVGYAVIDPVSKPEDHLEEPLQRYQWDENCRLEAALAQTNIPGMQCDFVVLNAINPNELIFASKSILHNTMPGGSKYSKEKEPENGRIRALNTFVIKIEAISEKECIVKCINYADMGGKTSAFFNNLINQKGFFQPLYKRMKKASIDLNNNGALKISGV